MKNLFLRENVEQILDYIKEGIQIIDHKGTIIYCNRFITTLDDVKREDIIGKHILEVYPSLSYDTSTLLMVIESGKPLYDIQQTFVNYLGRRITTVNSTIPIKAQGKVVGAMEISQDITRVKELSERVIDLQAMLSEPNLRESLTLSKDPTLDNKGTADYSFGDIICSSKVMEELKHKAKKASTSSSPVLIYGRTGTGKELFVQSIHNESDRAPRPFIAQNCAALPSTLLESILFGTVKGSFTGADNRPGLFELAHGGTLFLDEINSMPLELQPKLLRVIGDGRVRRIGDSKTKDVDVRIITALNQHPEDALKAKLLREDLYYRLNVIYFELPTLEERIEDIECLVRHFIRKYNRKLSSNVISITNRAIDELKSRKWPGNVRELENVIEATMNLLDKEYIDIEDLPRGVRGRGTEITPLKERIRDFEQKAIDEALSFAGGNITKAAELLGMPRQTLQYKVGKLVSWKVGKEEI